MGSTDGGLGLAQERLCGFRNNSYGDRLIPKQTALPVKRSMDEDRGFEVASR
jgi:hypothetical protein